MSEIVKKLRVERFVTSGTADLLREAADRIEQLEAALLYATEYAGRLAVTLAEKHYPDCQQFELLPSLLGRIDQIDNMTCGMIRAALEGKNGNV